MDLDRLREFVVFGKTLSLSNASKELFIAPSTLSQHITQLEEDLGLNLIHRDKERRLTLEGQYLFAKSQHLLYEYDAMISQCQEIANRKKYEPMRISDYRAQIDFAPLEDLLTDSIDRTHNFDVDYIPNSQIEHLTEFEALDQGFVDIAFTFSSNPLSSEEIKSYARNGFGLFPMPKVTCAFKISRNHPFASSENVEAFMGKKWLVLQIDLPIFRSNERAIAEGLQNLGVNFESIKVDLST